MNFQEPHIFKRLLFIALSCFLAFISFQQSALADIPVKSPIPPTRSVIGWTGMHGTVSSPSIICTEYEAENNAQIPGGWGWQFSGIKPNPGSRPDALAYDCYYKSTYSDGRVVEMAFLSSGAIYGSTCSSPYQLEGGQCSLPPNKKDPCKEGAAECPCTDCGNPIDFSTGTKKQKETDYTSAAGSLELIRYYRSDALAQNIRNTDSPVPAPGYGWQHNYHRFVSPQTTAAVTTVTRPNGAIYSYALSNGSWIGDPDDDARLQQTFDTQGKPSGWVYTTASDTTETYDVNGFLVSLQPLSGIKQTLMYDTKNLLQSVTDAFGRQLKFSYDELSRLKQMTIPDGGLYTYAYDAAGNLASVTYPDNQVRRYVYENTAFPHALTGIIDEKGVRFATWTYNENGWATSSEHANGVEKYTIVSYGSRQIVDPLGATRSYSLSPMADGTQKIVNYNQPPGPDGVMGITRFAYNNNGNVTSKTNFNGTVTTLDYDLSRNLETKRVNASGTAQAQTTTTSWHANYRVPVQINGPLLRTSFTYDAKGNMLSKTDQATSDADGSQGVSSAVTGSPRTWTYTYNDTNQVLSFTGPRTDVLDRTTYVYDTQGNLTTITNAAGHVTTLSNYDGNGRVGQITDANGVVTSLTYTPRGWLKQRVSTVDGISETTSFDYDNVGQLITVTWPDNTSISYSYDDAHRLTRISDSLGNSINYTLDNMGNRINETVTDSSGRLTRQISRNFDVLGHLQKITGGAQ